MVIISPLRIGLFPFQLAFSWLINGGEEPPTRLVTPIYMPWSRGRNGSPWLLTTYPSWDDPPKQPPQSRTPSPEIAGVPYDQGLWKPIAFPRNNGRLWTTLMNRFGGGVRGPGVGRLTIAMMNPRNLEVGKWWSDHLHDIRNPKSNRWFNGFFRFLERVGSGLYNPQTKARYTWYISTIYCQLGDYILPTTLYRNLKKSIDWCFS